MKLCKFEFTTVLYYIFVLLVITLLSERINSHISLQL